MQHINSKYQIATQQGMVNFKNNSQVAFNSNIRTMTSTPKMSHNAMQQQFNKGKMTKTIMSPLTTMPSKNNNNTNNNNNNNNNNNSLSANYAMTEKVIFKSPLIASTTDKSNIDMRLNTTNNNKINTTTDKATKVVVEPFGAEQKKHNVHGAVNYAVGYKSQKVLLGDVHPYIICNLCKGYLIEATTIVECLHTFCHSCLMKHLRKEKFCPQCEMMINKSKTNIKIDATIQAIVYKLVPGLYEKELLRKRAFYREHPREAKLATPEQRGDEEHLIFSPSDNISLSLDYAEKDSLDDIKEDPNVQRLLKTKFLQCPGVFKIEHLKKFVTNKFMINSMRFNVEISYKVKTIVLPDYYTLIDVAYIYTWKRESPMVFFFRIIAKDSKTDELPEVALRRSPATLHSIQEEVAATKVVEASKKKSVSFKDDVTNGGQVNRCENGQTKELININNKINIEPISEKNKGSKTESIKMKFDVSNKNVSIIKTTTSSPSSSVLSIIEKDKAEAKQKKKLEKLEKKNRNESLLLQKDTSKDINKVDNSLNNVTIKKEKDEYDFEDDIDEKKLGFLNTFQLTAKRNLKPDYRAKVDSSATVAAAAVTKPTEPSANKRKSKEPVKVSTKKYKFHEMKTVNELSTKTGAGREISFDMSPKPLGSKPSLSKVKNDILQRQQKADAAAEAKATNELVKTTVPPMVPLKKLEVEMPKEPIKVVQAIKPKKLPMLLPKSIDSMMPPPPPPLVSPIPFIIKKPEFKKPAISEISVTRIHDDNRKVYGPKSSINNVQQKSTSSKTNQSQAPVNCPSNFMSKPTNDGFLSPSPPKPKSNNVQGQQLQAPQPYMRSFGMPKLPKNIPANMVTPYGMRTPFYTPNSPVYSPNSSAYTPNFDAKPQYKYTNPSAYASFLQSMFNCSNNQTGNKSPPPVNKNQPTMNQQQLLQQQQQNLNKDNNLSRKRTSNESPENSPLSKRKSPSPPQQQQQQKQQQQQNQESDPKYISILNKINFPSSLSVTITNEQEENKKEHMRNLKQNVVNNNIEIIKLPEAELNLIKNNLASLAAANNASNANVATTEPKVNATEKRKMTNEPKKLVPILPAPAPHSGHSPPIANVFSSSNESFQKKFLESLETANIPITAAEQKKIQIKLKREKLESEMPEELKTMILNEEKKMSALNVTGSNGANALKIQDNIPNLIAMPRQPYPPLFKLPKKPLQAMPPRRQSVCFTTSKHDEEVRASKIQKTKSLTPPPSPSSSGSTTSSSSGFNYKNNNSSAIQFNMMLNGLMSVAAKSNFILPNLPEYANMQRTMMLEQLRQNVEKSNVLLAMQHHQINQLQPPNNDKTNMNSKKSN